MPDDSRDFITQRHIELGMMVGVSAGMEHILRSAFCSLVGSKFAATVAGGQSVSWLIDQCQALTDVHHEMPDEHRQAIKDALGKCKAANNDRNVLMHGMNTGISLPSGNMQSVRSRPRTHVPQVQPWTIEKIHAAAWALAEARSYLFAAMMNAVSPEMMVIDQGLAWDDYRRRQEETP